MSIAHMKPEDRLRELVREDDTVTRAYVTVVCEPPEMLPSVGICRPADLVSEFSSLGIDIAVTIYLPDDEMPTDESDDCIDTS